MDILHKDQQKFFNNISLNSSVNNKCCRQNLERE